MVTDTSAATSINKWKMTAYVLRTSSSHQAYFQDYTRNSSSFAGIANWSTGTATETDTAAITIKCTGTGGAASDITQNALLVFDIN